MASSDNIEHDDHRRSGALSLVAATIVSIGLANAPFFSSWYLFWTGILAVASVPVVVLSLRGQRLGRSLSMVFIPATAVGAIAHLLWTNPLTLLAAPAILWLMCLIAGLTSPGRPARLVANPGHCGSCAYDLTGNVSGACPECGEAVGPVAIAGSRWWPALRTLLLWLVGAAAGLSLFGFIFYKALSQPI